MHQALEVVKMRAKQSTYSTIIPAENFKLASFMECQSSQSWSAAAWDYCLSILTHEEHYPVGDQIFQFATTDRKTIGCLRERSKYQEIVEVAKGTQSPEMNRNFASLHPSELPSWFFSAGPQWMLKEKCLRMPRGYWTEKNLSAVRGATSRCYVGVKRRLDFYLLSDAKTGWTMTQYYNLRMEGIPPDNLVIEDKMIMCKVSHLERTSSSTVPEGSRLSSKYTKEYFELFLEEVSSSNSEEFSIQDGELDGGREQKSRRKSEVWKHFIRVSTKDPEDVYAICHTCDGMLKAGAKKHGTTHLKRHPCYNRHLQQ